MGTTATTVVVCWAVLGLSPASEVPEEKVDLIEINHFHDDQGRPVFDQIIFYDWSASVGRYQVRDWRLLKSPNQIPLYNARDQEFVAVWNDFKAHDTLRATKAKVVRETWTQYDPELVEREFLPENKRRKLRDVSNPKKSLAPTGSASSSSPEASPMGREQADQRSSSAAPLRPLQ